MELKKYKLGDCLTMIENGAVIKQKKNAGGIPITRIETLSNDRFNRDRLGYADIFDESSYSHFILDDMDLIMSHINSRTFLGRTVIYRKHGDEKIIHGMNVLRLKTDIKVLNPLYAYYYFKTNGFRTAIDHIRKDAINQSSLATSDIKNLEILIPSIEEQSVIVSILDNLDRKIALNRSINQNLEALAKQLYDYWFVQFDFPDENGRLYKSSGGKMVWYDGLKKYIPNYWNVLKLSDLLREDRVKQINPQDNPNKVFRHLSFPSLDACGSFYEEKGENIKSNKIVVKDEYVLAAKLNPWIKRIAWGTTDEDLICSTEFVVLNPYDKSLKAFLFLLVNQKPFIDYCTSSSTGTSHSQRRVKPDIMKLYKFPYNEKVAQEFSKQVLPIIEITKKNNEQNRELVIQRDKLLPLLMNGQVSLNSDLSNG